MNRLLAVATLALVLAQVAGAPVLAGLEACLRASPDEEPDDCGPLCLDCACCPAHRSVAAAAGPDLLAPEGRPLAAGEAPVFLPVPAPQEILHIPRPARA